TPVGRTISKPTTDDEEDSDVPSAPPPKSEREQFKTDAGRIVYGGGGITPDVEAGDTIIPPNNLAFLNAVGRKTQQFRDAVTDFAMSLRGTTALTSPDFVVTDAMRDEVWRRMRQRGIEMDRALYDAAAPLVSRFIAYDVARYVFGRTAEQRRIVQDFPEVQKAVELLRGVNSPKELLARVGAEQARRTGE
ncbi:MAG: carboxyl-terminal protease, partial [Geminicoccaceae bacterium]|nr:carboxyl-terminal protease [Geminicoccaceae bacterium]